MAWSTIYAIATTNHITFRMSSSIPTKSQVLSLRANQASQPCKAENLIFDATSDSKELINAQKVDLLEIISVLASSASECWQATIEGSPPLCEKADCAKQIYRFHHRSL